MLRLLLLSLLKLLKLCVYCVCEHCGGTGRLCSCDGTCVTQTAASRWRFFLFLFYFAVMLCGRC